MKPITIDSKQARMVAHRGLSGIERENTNAAFVAAGNRSYFGIETDIHRTADGKFVVCHDGSLARVGGEAVEVEKVSLAVSQSVRLFDKDGGKSRCDLQTPSLEEYISICKCYEKHCVLELKSTFTEEEIGAIINTIRSLEYLNEVTFIAFDYDNLVKIRSVLPTQSVQFLTKEVTDELIDRLAEARMDLDVAYRALTEENLAALHARGIRVNCWTVDDPAEGERLAAMGVDFITTNILE